ncbi:MAG: radical SAM protein [Candidatus Buchananbacteria bacterium]
MISQIKKKIKKIFRVAYWFLIYDLLRGDFKKPWHLVVTILKHWFLKLPHSAIIETGNTCNFKCPTCPTPHHLIHARRPAEMMTLERYKKIIDNVKRYIHVVYLYNSNEPLLNPHLIEMIKYASENNLHTMISTNGSLLNEEMADKLLSSGLGEIRFAFDGLTKESFEQFRIGGDFETVKKNIEYFCRLKKEKNVSKPILTLQFILNKLNQDQVADIKQFAKINGIDRLYIKPFILSEYAYSTEEINQLADKFFIDKEVTDENVVYKKDSHGLKPKRKIDKCPEADKIFSVLSDGRAVMCCFDLLGDYVYGKMDETDLYKLWNSKEAVFIRERARKRFFPLCKICGNIE